MTHPCIFSFRCSTLGHNEMADVIFHILQILLLDGDKKNLCIFRGEIDIYEMMLSELKNQRYLLVIRNDMRVGGPRTGCTLW